MVIGRGVNAEAINCSINGPQAVRGLLSGGGSVPCRKGNGLCCSSAGGGGGDVRRTIGLCMLERCRVRSGAN